MRRPQEGSGSPASRRGERIAERPYPVLKTVAMVTITTPPLRRRAVLAVAETRLRLSLARAAPNVRTPRPTSHSVKSRAKATVGRTGKNSRTGGSAAKSGNVPSTR